MLDFSHYPAKSKYYDDLNAVVVGNMKGKRTALLLKNLLD